MLDTISPVKPKERYVILDALRGLALLGICLANFPEFSLYTFLNKEVTASMSTVGIDTVVKYLQYIFIDGKFYTLFSLLFGISFSIILSNAAQKNKNGLMIFYRRMIALFFIGLFHLLFLWAGDILILYAFVGFFLPLFRNVSNKKLLTYSIVLLLVPILIDACIVVFNWNLSALVISATQYFHGKFGITEESFPIWLVESKTYLDVLKFNIAGSFIRMQEFIEGNRAFKVLGLFLLGLYIGRNKIYANLESNKNLLKKVAVYGFIIGFPTSLLYAWSAMSFHPLGLVGHSVIYAVSVVPLAFAYISAICLWYLKNKEQRIFRLFASPGRMALTNYLMQSVWGIILFYGIGFALGAKTGLVYVELIALAIFAIQMLYSSIWLHYNQYGPLEWGWRMLTYKKWLKLSK
jgi:Predicted membrane protein